MPEWERRRFPVVIGEKRVRFTDRVWLASAGLKDLNKVAQEKERDRARRGDARLKYKKRTGSSRRLALRIGNTITDSRKQSR
jgi:hypothetical protein